MIVPWVVLLVALLATLMVALDLHRSLHTAEEQRFRREVAQAGADIHTRIETYIATLRAGAALFTNSEHVTREEFAGFAASLDLQRHYPGIQGIGYSKAIGTDGMQPLVEEVRQSGIEDFRVWPDTPREQYHTIVYLEPLDRRNRAALGYDMFSHSERRRAMERARDTGEPAASSRVILVQEIDDQKQAGFLIYVPVYRGSGPPTTVTERRLRLDGFVYAPFRTDDLLGAIFRGHTENTVAFRVFDGEEPIDRQVLHNKLPQGISESATHHLLQRFVIAGRPWTIEYFSTPAFEAEHSHRYVYFIGAGGGLISLVLFGLTRSQTSARLRAEHTAAELRKSEAALRRSESRFRRLSESNIVGVAFGRTNGEVFDANDAACRILGCSRQEILHNAVRWNDRTPPEYRAADQQAIRELRQRGVCTPFEKEFLRPDGSRIPVLVGAAAIEESSDDMVTIIVDLTERKKAEQAIDDARQTAEQANRLKDDFLATVSHELRTPLNAILGWTQLLRAGGNTPEDLQRGMEVIDRSARTQAQLIDDLLDVSRIISGNMRLHVQPIDIQPAIDAAIASVQPAANARDLRIIRNLSETLPQIFADPMRVQQILWNLLTNAIKFTPRSGQITLAAQHANNELRLSISDSGMGIDPKFLPFVFERFRQGDASFSRKFGGLGLGLGIVRHLVELHGGTVSAASEGPGQGATFTVCLPGVQPDHQAPPRAQPAPAGHPSFALGGTTILVLDDEPDARELLTRLLEPHGAKVIEADSVEQAMAQIHNVWVDLVLSDLGLPDVDGYAFIQRLRAFDREQDRMTPAVAVTAYTRQQDRERTLREGYDMHLSKPLNPEELIAVVYTLLNRSAE